MARALVIEGGERGFASALLDAHGFTVFVAVEPNEALQTLESFKPEVVLLEAATADDKMLQLCSAIRAACAIPIIVVTGLCSEAAAVATFAAGADGLVNRTTGPHELVAHVRALLRRSAPLSVAPSDRIVVGPVVLDRLSRELLVNGETLAVPRREFDIAERLMRDAGRVVLRDALVRDIWGSMRDTKSLDVQVGRLRTRLALAEGRRRIVTVRGVGFRFMTDEELDEAASRAELDLELVHLLDRPDTLEKSTSI